MSKHRLSSPDPLPPAKRLHTTSQIRQIQIVHSLSLDAILYDELILAILSHLSWVDLCVMQATNRKFYRLATDNELWRSLYLRVFGRLRLRGARGFTVRSDGKEVKPLPGRASNYKDWKWMFRISSNWRKGRCAVETLNESSADPAENHILLTGSMTITAGRSLSVNPAIKLLYGAPNVTHILQAPASLGMPCNITQLAVDQSRPSSGRTRLAAFLSNGEFSIYSISSSSPSQPGKEANYVPSRRSSRTVPIIAAAYHHPLLVTLSESFSLSIYDLSTSQVQLVQTLTSFSSYPPTSLVLSAPSAHTYRLVLAHTIPVYPSHWSVAATEFIISGQEPHLSSPSSLLLSTPDFVPLSIVSVRRTRAIDVPQGWIDENKLRVMQEQASRKVLQVADTQTDGKWVVLAPAESLAYNAVPSPPHSPFTSPPGHSEANLQLYRLSLPSPSSIASSPPKLTFVRTLCGQTGPISALALADGRCVSLASNGSIWVWDLECGTGAQVSGPRLEPISSTSLRGTVAFDDRKIITSEQGKTVVRRFDI